MVKRMTSSEKAVHAGGYILLSTLIGAFLALYMSNRKPWLTKKGRLIKTLKDLTSMAEQIITETSPKKKPSRVQHHKNQKFDDEHIDHIRKHGEP